jgi:hypothetical protein
MKRAWLLDGGRARIHAASAVIVHMHGAVSVGAAPALRDSFMIAHAIKDTTLLYMCSILRRVNRSCVVTAPARLHSCKQPAT